jgi:hypothetical protein
MTIGLDVHVLVMDYTPAEQVERCRESIRVAAEQAGYPVVAHFLPGVLGHLGKARGNGYALGSHQYVTHVDDDDWLQPDAFAVLAEQLRAGVEAVTTGENLVQGDSVAPAPESRHHLAVYRREYVRGLGYASFRYYPDQYLLSMCEPVHLPVCVYNHRINMNSGSRRQRRAKPHEARLELEVIKRPDLAVVENACPAYFASAIDRELRGK